MASLGCAALEPEIAARAAMMLTCSKLDRLDRLERAAAECAEATTAPMMSTLQAEGTFCARVIGLRPKVQAAADGSGLGHVGPRSLADLADATGLSVA
ncbi:hypothetical protein ACWD0Z_18180 [Streptomyces sp. NPDC003007]